MFEPLVSIITPCYNGEKYLSETIESVLKQSYQNFKLLVVDDCSTDDSAAIVMKFCELDERVKYICLPENTGGPASPRNVGVKHSEGEYIAFIDADDLWHPDKLRIQIKYMVDNNLSFSSTDKVNFRGEFVMLSVPAVDESTIPTKRISIEKLLQKNYINNSSVVVKSDAIVGKRFNESAIYVAVEDYNMWLQIHNEIDLSHKIMLPLLYYRVLGDSISASKLNMARKFYNVIRNYRTQENSPLGFLQCAYYTATYVYLSISSRILIRLGLSRG